ncbi:MAG: hypothetical protein JNM69_28150 [Archangium sp.]|nr:hypothetical protein [Archangium sp.]
MKLIALVGLLAGTAEATSCGSERVELLPSQGVIPTQPVLVLNVFGASAEHQLPALVFRSGKRVVPALVSESKGEQHFVRAERPLTRGAWTLEAPAPLLMGRTVTRTLGRFTVTTKPMPAIFVGPPRFLGFEQQSHGSPWSIGRIAATGPSAAAVLAELKLEGLHYSRTVVVGIEDGEARFGDFMCWSLPHLPNGRHLNITVTPVALDGLRGDPTSFEVDVPGVNEPTEEELEALDAETPKKFVPAHLNER